MRTACGRARVNSLLLNREGVMNLRSLLVLAGKHPPDFGRGSISVSFDCELRNWERVYLNKRKIL